MAVSDEYLSKIRFAVRRNESTLMDSELTDVIEQCKADLVRMGVPYNLADDESNQLVLGCVRAYARWQTGGGGAEPEKSREDYRLMANDLRNSINEAEYE